MELCQLWHPRRCLGRHDDYVRAPSSLDLTYFIGFRPSWELLDALAGNVIAIILFGIVFPVAVYHARILLQVWPD